MLYQVHNLWVMKADTCTIIVHCVGFLCSTRKDKKERRKEYVSDYWFEQR